MIVVTTPTGQIGRNALQSLLAKGEKVRVIARDPSKLPENVKRQAEIVEGSHGDAAVIERALRGADGLLWVVPPEPRSDNVEKDYVDFSRPAAKAIDQAHVHHVVVVKAIAHGTPWVDRAGLATVSERMDELFTATSASVRSIAAPSLMDNMLMQLHPITHQGMFFGPIEATKKIPHLAARDIGYVAADLLVQRDWHGKSTINLLGPENLSFNEVAGIIAEVLGMPVEYQQVPFEGFAAQLQGLGMPESYVRKMVEMMQAKNEGLDNSAPRDTSFATPTTFRQWCEGALAKAARA